MMVLKSCKGRTCVEPWRELHPSGDVNSLLESLKPEFDVFYQDQPKVSFSDCKVAYFPEFEGPMEVNKFKKDAEEAWWWPKELKRDVSNGDNKYRGRWSHWT